ncbi:LOW QUALITY PROTEIN: muellerian-inhibiting factor [Polymixia lowei]
MLVLCVFCCSALALFRSGKCAPHQVAESDGLHGQKQFPAPDPTRTDRTRSSPMMDAMEMGGGLRIKNTGYTSSDATVSHHLPENAPCFRRSRGHGEILDDMFAVLREGGGKDGELRNNDLTRFGVCTNSDGSAGAVLSELASKANSEERRGVDVLQPNKELLEAEEGGGRLVLTLDLPQSPLLKLQSILLLAFGSPHMAKDLSIIFTSQSLHPNTQTVCISEQTQYIILKGKASEGHGHQKWRLSLEAKSPDTGNIWAFPVFTCSVTCSFAPCKCVSTAGQKLREILIGGVSGSNISITPLLLFWLDRGTDMRLAEVPGSSLGSSETFSFLCELQRFLGDVQPQNRPKFTPVQLKSLQSLPSLTLGLSSSETLLVGLLNSSGPTLFTFPTEGSALQVHRGELALPPALLEILRQRLEQTVAQMTEVIREEEVGDRTMERLGRLRALSAFPEEEPAAGESQYRAFLLLKALQTVARAYEAERGLRATRAGQDSPVRANLCGLHSLTVSLERYLVGPNTATINNCQGICSFPLYNGNNHAILLNAQIQNGRTLERSLCCVPVAYEDLEVVELNEGGTYLSIKPNMVAKECGCR